MGTRAVASAETVDATPQTIWDLAAPWWSLVFLIILLGAVVRGFGGFGASMVWVGGMSLLLPPATAIPTALLLEVLASAQLLPQVWRYAHWRSLSWMLVGVVIGLPLGTWALVSVPARPMRLILGATVLIAVILMASGFRSTALPGARGSVAVGSVSGALNGAFAMGGPPAILMYFSSPSQVRTGRASLVVFFLFTDLLGTASAGVGGLITIDLLRQVLMLVPVTLLGVALGSWWFRRTGAKYFRRYVLWLLAVLACVIVTQAAWG